MPWSRLAAAGLLVLLLGAAAGPACAAEPKTVAYPGAGSLRLPPGFIEEKSASVPLPKATANPAPAKEAAAVPAVPHSPEPRAPEASPAKADPEPAPVRVAAPRSDAIPALLRGEAESARAAPAALSADRSRGKPKVIVIDAGHGGVDPGAESVAGYFEKEITLATALAVKSALESTGRYKVALTRPDDVFVVLHDRVTRARMAGGDLFLSLHADSTADGPLTVSSRSVRGASVYTLSAKASDAQAERYAQRENRADLLGGIGVKAAGDDVASILVDLTMRETMNQSKRFANLVVRELDQSSIGTVSNPHRSAGFAVLKAPEIPSVLIEMGYLSDAGDSRLLAADQHQRRFAQAMLRAIDRYFALIDGPRRS